MTYKKNKQRAIKYGIEYIKWTYFKDMDKIFKNTPEGCKKDNYNISNSIKINFYVFSIAPELNDIITVSLIDDDELDEVKKENEAYNNQNIVDETHENNEEELIELPSSGK